jgi:hypothetical protein
MKTYVLICAHRKAQFVEHSRHRKILGTKSVRKHETHVALMALEIIKEEEYNAKE